MMRLRSALLLAAVLLAASAIAGVAQPRLGRSADTPATPAPTRTITVSGNGTVTTVPERASFSFTVEARAQTAAAAIAKSSDAASSVAAAVKGAGAAPADIQTSQVSLSPQTTQDGTTIIGYVASNTISVTSSIGKAGTIVDAAVNAGADGVSGPGLSRSDETSLYKDALKDAVADAKDKASALAAAAGLTLGGVQSIQEGSMEPPVMWAAAKADPGPVPIEPGTQSITASVTVTYAAG
jgi:uncharacterized protein YggE